MCAPRKPHALTERRQLSPARLMAFTAVAVFGLLAGGNALVEWLERGTALDTKKRDDAVQFVEEGLFAVRGDALVTTAYAERDMVPASMAAAKGDGFRAFVVGGSFAMGTPYVSQHGELEGGGFPSFVQTELERRLPERRVEVVNAAAGGQDSSRVRQIVEEIVELEPDVIVVATCNNEGAPRPGFLREYLHRQGGFRLLRNLLAPEPTEQPRGWYTPQDEDSEAVRGDFGDNIERILDVAAQRSIPVLLATLPVNLRYFGFDPGHGVRDEDEDDTPVRPRDPAPGDAPEVTDEVLGRLPCRAGISLFEAASWEAALPLLHACLAEESDPVGEAPYITTYIALAELELGRGAEAARLRLVDRWGECLADGILAIYGGDPRGAIEQLSACDDVAEALRWVGRAHLELGEAERAAELLAQAVELRPSNRCRPSFNDALRQQAQGRNGVTLVDLEQVARDASPDRVPGPELFVDYCHMNWRGYALVGRAVVDALVQLDGSLAGTGAELSPDEFAARFDLPRGDNAAQVRAALANSKKGAR